MPPRWPSSTDAWRWKPSTRPLTRQSLVAASNASSTDPAKGFYLVAESAGQIVGQLMVTYEWSDWRDGWIWWIQSVYVREDHRRHGVFRSLYEAVVEQARSAGNVVGIRLYVEKDNTRAQATYQRLGMYDASYLVLEAMLSRMSRVCGLDSSPTDRGRNRTCKNQASSEVYAAPLTTRNSWPKDRVSSLGNGQLGPLLNARSRLPPDPGRCPPAARRRKLRSRDCVQPGAF